MAAGQVGGARRRAAAGSRGRRRRSRPARAAGPSRCRRRSAGRRPARARSAPRERSVATLARVAGCSHISVCIAGAKTTGQRAVSRVAVSRSSARPAAARASRSAVAGATTTRSASRPSADVRRPRATSVQTSVATGSPDSAAQVGAPTNCSAAVGRDDPYAWPDSVSGAAAHRPCTRRCRRRRRGRPGDCAAALGTCTRGAGYWSICSEVSRPALISRRAIDSGFSCTWVSTSGPTYSSRPSPSWE